MTLVRTSGLLVSLLCLSACGAQMVGEPRCDLTKLDVHPQKPGDFASYVGKGTTVELEWVNPSPSKPTDRFDEPPLVIWNLATGDRCEIGGGIWLKDEMYLSSDERTVVLKSHSGSSMHFEFYETKGCQRFANIEVSGPTTVVEPNRVTFNGGCEYTDETKKIGWCSPAAIYVLENGCHVTFLEQQSRALTKKLFGTEFTKFSEIEFPFTPQARVLQTRP